jgi:2-polyprenyl-3-methyl-5-hydroxy-6-metoxy-1,4-benzoquinol methylase
MCADPYLFGGSPKQVRRTQQRFVRCFSPGHPILDVGCGRGIFLQLLKESGLEAIGIDTYGPAVERCKELGFTAYRSDVLDYLRTTSTAFGGIFCSHVIEHLPFHEARELLSLCAEALVPAGILVIVTPNPRDFGVMGETFWLDPTHVRPYPPALIASIAEDANLNVIRKGTYHGGLPKREWGRALLYRWFLGPFYGRPNAYVVAQKLSGSRG